MMYRVTTLLLFSFLFACAPKGNSEKRPSEKGAIQKYVASVNQLIDSANVVGAVLIYDAQKNTYYSNDFDWAEKAHLPASTFKIANSMIALETSVVEDENTVLMWDGRKRAFKSWEADMTFKEAFHKSCLPCYQQLTREMGVENMQEYTQKLDYGKLVFDSTTYDSFWVAGKSGINQFQQIEFLIRFYTSQLPISARTEKILKKMIRIAGVDEEYKLSAKTGWSNQNDVDNGWYVGYLEKDGNVYYFATNISPGADYDITNFFNDRKLLTMASFEKLGIIEAY